MAENTKIEWCDHTLNSWEGCQKVSPECDNCYAETRNERFHGGENWGPKAPRRRTSVQTWNKARKWNREADAFFAQHRRRQRVFCASLADVFDNAVDPAWRADLWELIRECDQLDWLLLTKRPQNIAKMLPEDWGDGWSHVWLGTSAGCQESADKNITALLNVHSSVHFVSCEPMLGHVDLSKWLHDSDCPPWSWAEGCECRAAGGPFESTVDWVICGGESGPKARPMHPDWPRSLRDQCQAAGVPFFFKQWGEWKPISQMESIEHERLYRSNFKAKPHEDQAIIDDIYGTTCTVPTLVLQIDGNHLGQGEIGAYGEGAMLAFRVGKKAAGRLLDGKEWNEVPA